MFSLLLPLRKFQRFRELWASNLGWGINICEKIYFGYLNDQIYVSHKSQYHKLIESTYLRNICRANQHVNKDVITTVSPEGKLAGKRAMWCFSSDGSFVLEQMEQTEQLFPKTDPAEISVPCGKHITVRKDTGFWATEFGINSSLSIY